MFEKYNEKARRALFFARYEASKLGSRVIETEHVLLGIAQLLLLPNWFAGLAGPGGAGILFGFRVYREERMMLDFFGDEYRAYMAETKRIVPWIF